MRLHRSSSAFGFGYVRGKRCVHTILFALATTTATAATTAAALFTVTSDRFLLGGRHAGGDRIFRHLHLGAGRGLGRYLGLRFAPFAALGAFAPLLALTAFRALAALGTVRPLGALAPFAAFPARRSFHSF
ncbi:MAG: hypothetical protein KGQ57_16615, partial [Burkholderiales bacterium]|nr:hypothetical protein [Burkholderiales bacterium]